MLQGAVAILSWQPGQELKQFCQLRWGHAPPQQQLALKQVPANARCLEQTIAHHISSLKC